MAKIVKTIEGIAPKYRESLRIPLNPCKSLDYVKADSRKRPISGIPVCITREHPSNWVDLIIMWENRSAMPRNIARPTNVRH